MCVYAILTLLHCIHIDDNFKKKKQKKRTIMQYIFTL